jgi:adenylate cyclase
MPISSMQSKLDQGPVSPENKPEKPKEIERKFLIKDLPLNLEEFMSEEISQGYVEIEPNGSEKRVRDKEGRFFYTEKSGGDVIRDEEEREITREEYDAYWKETEGKRIKKTRYYIPYKDCKIELDIYYDKLAGLFSAEVEFKTKEESDNFIPPAWFGEEVTKDKRYKNKSLAVNGLPGDEESGPKQKEGREIPEYHLEEGVGKLIEAVRNKINEQDGIIIVAIAGGSASGKTSLVAQKVKDSFSGEAMMFSMDNYFKGKAFIESEAQQGRTINFDMPEYLNLKLVKEHLSALKRNEPIQMPIYNFANGAPDGTTTQHPKRIIILEGIHALNDKIVDEEDLKVFVEIGMHGRMIRRLLRDIERTGRNPYDILKFFTNTVEPMHEQHIETTKKNADMIIKNEYRPDVEAQKSGKFEFQLKFKLEHVDKEALRKAGAQKLSVTNQVDYYYNPKDRDLKSTGEILRIRHEGGQKMLTYKGPKMDAKVRKRPIFEFDIDEQAEESLLSVYGENSKIISKSREMYQLDDCVVSIDRVNKTENGTTTFIGYFLEIRLPNGELDEEKIKATLAKIDPGLKFDQGIKDGYFEM